MDQQLVEIIHEIFMPEINCLKSQEEVIGDSSSRFQIPSEPP